MEVLYYQALNLTAVKASVEKVVACLQRGDFRSAQVKKLKPTPYYRAKLDDRNRLLFQLKRYQGKTYALLLEVIENHAYDKSRFLRGVKVDESQLVETITSLDHRVLDELPYLNTGQTTFQFLDKIISWDDEQAAIYHYPLPLILIGSAGSGKTILSLEKLKNLAGHILYLTQSPYLVENARNRYYAHQYASAAQEVAFLSYAEFVASWRVPAGQEMTIARFMQWLTTYPRVGLLQDSHKLYEEFKGVITGSQVTQKYLTRTDYQQLGIKQSIYAPEERLAVYDYFEKYLAYLAKTGQYDSNLLAFDYLPLCQPVYDYILIDEVQDLTPIQLYLVLKALKQPSQFLLCGDSHQIVHPNFFSWAKIKSLFYQQALDTPADITRLLSKNYRNAHRITQLANRLLRIKNKRFGSIDPESTYLIDSTTQEAGHVYCVPNTEPVRQDLNAKTQRSIKYAVIVLDEAAKQEAQQFFSTPLLFSVQEAKGLEYENVILYNFVSHHADHYLALTDGVNPADVAAPLTYSRVKDKADRSLELYKFYTNALYVAITRAIKQVYLIETLPSHRLLDLLEVQSTQEPLPLTVEPSSQAEWQQEARRLELQGKQAQADAIKAQLLPNQTVPWTVLTPSALASLQQQAFAASPPNKAARLRLVEYAVIYQQKALLIALAKLGFKPAQHPHKAWDFIERKYFLFYNSSNYTHVFKEIAHYGIDYRNAFNHTPLMVASLLGNTGLVQALLAQGADPHLLDSSHKSAYHIALQRACGDKKFAHAALASLHPLIAPSHLSLTVNAKLVKLDARTMEYSLLQLLCSILHQYRFPLTPWRHYTFCTQDLMMALQHFPAAVVPDWRKRRSYLSSLLAKHEMQRQDQYNQQLFVRVKRGYYRLNPDLNVQQGGQWFSLQQLVENSPPF